MRIRIIKDWVRILGLGLGSGVGKFSRNLITPGFKPRVVDRSLGLELGFGRLWVGG